MKKSLLVLLILLFTSSCNKKQKSASTNVQLKTDVEKSFYAIGAMFGGRLNTLSLSSNEVLAVQEGIADAAQGKKLKVDAKKYQAKVQKLFKDRMTKAAQKTKKDGASFVEKFLKEGGTKTASGLAYKIEKQGTSVKPIATDLVKVHYKGTLLNGTEFDSSYKRGQPVTFPLNRVIKGWTEGLQLIGVGGKIKLVVPSDLAYGDAGHPPTIPGGSTLIFDVELISIEKKPAAPKANIMHSKKHGHMKMKHKAKRKNHKK